MDALEVIRLKTKIQATPFSADALRDAAASLSSIKSAVDSREICRVMSETWQEEVVPLARELLAAKKASEREKGLELFAYIPDASLIPEVETAKEGERAKKLHRTYDYTVRRIREACERNSPSVDPRDTQADPNERMRVLAGLPYEELWSLTGLRERYWADIEPTSDTDAAGAVDKRFRRLRAFLRSGQTQPYWLMQLLYIAHPLAGESATQLVWQANLEGKWVAFRGTTGGGACDENATPLDVDVSTEVRLAHPAELSAAQHTAWTTLAAMQKWSCPFSPLTVPVLSLIHI